MYESHFIIKITNFSSFVIKKLFRCILGYFVITNSLDMLITQKCLDFFFLTEMKVNLQLHANVDLSLSGFETLSLKK